MKKVFALILALCMFAALLPMTVLADTTEPTTEATTEATEAVVVPVEAKVRCFYASKKNFTMTFKVGTSAYIFGDENKVLTKWTDKETVPETNFVRFELVAGEPAVMKVTFNNFNVDCSDAGGYTCHGIWFQGSGYDIEIELIGENTMVHTKSACIKVDSDSDITISGPGSLSLTQNGSAPGPLWCNGGDLLIKGATMSFSVNPGETNSPHHAIFVSKGSVVLEDSTFNSVTRGGSLVYLGTTDAEAGGTGKGRHTPTTDESRTITVKNCDITATTHTGAVLHSASPAVISGCTMSVGKTSSSGTNIFPVAPTFEGDYTAMAGLLKNKDNPTKLKAFNPNKIGSYTYISVVPYATEETTEATTEATEPVVTEPVVTEPVVTEPKATEPAPTEATQPATTEATEPAPTEDVDNTSSSNPLKVVLIIVLALIVVTAAALVVLIVLKKKKG